MAKTIDQLSIFVENKAGSLVRITGILAEAQIDIRAMSLADTADFGILRLIVDQPQKAEECLRDNSCIVSVNKVIAVPIADAPGSLCKVLRLLSDNGIFIEYSYAFITRRTNNAYVIFRLDDNERAEAVLEANDIMPSDAANLFEL